MFVSEEIIHLLSLVLWMVITENKRAFNLIQKVKTIFFNLDVKNILVSELIVPRPCIN